MIMQFTLAANNSTVYLNTHYIMSFKTGILSGKDVTYLKFSDKLRDIIVTESASKIFEDYCNLQKACRSIS